MRRIECPETLAAELRYWTSKRDSFDGFSATVMYAAERWSLNDAVEEPVVLSICAELRRRGTRGDDFALSLAQRLQALAAATGGS